mgnify:FL=1
MKIILQHKKETPSKTLEDICNIKSKRWNYTQDQCKVWIEENLEEDDYHLCIYIKNNIIAYMNFVFIEAKVNDSIIPFVGIGNVCTAESGKGYGDLLMKEVNKIIEEKSWKGILFCKDALVPYYEKYNWELVDLNCITSEEIKKHNTMLYNLEKPIASFEYTGRKF